MRAPRPAQRKPPCADLPRPAALWLHVLKRPERAVASGARRAVRAALCADALPHAERVAPGTARGAAAVDVGASGLDDASTAHAFFAHFVACERECRQRGEEGEASKRHGVIGEGADCRAERVAPRRAASNPPIRLRTSGAELCAQRPDRLPDAVEARLHGRRAEPELVRDLFLGLPVHVHRDEERFVHGVERVELFGHDL